jgi:PPM family protein phosphatase
MKFQAFGLSDTGCVRKQNEDYYLVDEDLGLYVVCDGLGGHASGEVASKTCAEVLRESVAAGRGIIESYRAERSSANRAQLGSLLQSAIQKANAKVFALSESDPALKGMGTTVAALLVAQDIAILAHVGDSRIYLERAEKFHVLTQDHKVSAELARQGVWSKEEAARSPYADVLTRAVGPQEFVQVDLLQLELVPGDLFLICSDGLYRYFKGREFPDAAARTEVSRLPGEMIELARRGGGKDNITAVVVKALEDSRMAAAMGVMKRGELLGRIPLFRYLSYAELMKVLSIVDLRELKRGTVLIEEGTPGDEMFIICSGSVDVVKKGAQKIASIQKGEMFGEMSIFDNSKRSASIVAAESATLMALSRKELLPLLRRESSLAVKFLWALNQDLNQRLRVANKNLVEVKAQAAAQSSQRDELPFDLPPLEG